MAWLSLQAAAPQLCLRAELSGRPKGISERTAAFHKCRKGMAWSCWFSLVRQVALLLAFAGFLVGLASTVILLLVSWLTSLLDGCM